MTPKECFGIAVRTIGVLVLFGSVMYLYSAVAILVLNGMPHTYPLVSYLGASVVAFAVGLYCLRGAPGIIGFAYPSSPTSATPAGMAE